MKPAEFAFGTVAFGGPDFQTRPSHNRSTTDRRPAVAVTERASACIEVVGGATVE